MTGEEVEIEPAAPAPPALSPYGFELPPRITAKLLERAYQAYRDAAPTWALWRGLPTGQQNPKRAAAMTHFLKTQGIDGWLMLLRKVGESPFLQNRTPRKVSALTFDYLLKPEIASRIMEGNYDDEFAEKPARQEPRQNGHDVGRLIREAAAKFAVGGDGDEDGPNGVWSD